jgi:hypothetical protein
MCFDYLSGLHHTVCFLQKLSGFQLPRIWGNWKPELFIFVFRILFISGSEAINEMYVLEEMLSFMPMLRCCA